MRVSVVVRFVIDFLILQSTMLSTELIPAFNTRLISQEN